MGRPKIYTDEEYIERARKRSREWRRKNSSRAALNPNMNTVIRERIPQYVIDDRERRRCYVPTLTQSIFGDPPPGQSALDQLRKR